MKRLNIFLLLSLSVLLFLSLTFALPPKAEIAGEEYHHLLTGSLKHGMELSTLLYYHLEKEKLDYEILVESKRWLNNDLESAKVYINRIEGLLKNSEKKSLLSKFESLKTHLNKASADVQIFGTEIDKPSPDRANLKKLVRNIYVELEKAETIDHKDIKKIRKITELSTTMPAESAGKATGPAEK